MISFKRKIFFGGIFMITKYADELTGQKDFYGKYLPLVDKSLTIESVQADNNDGVVNGNIIEFKLSISNLTAVLFQTIKYLSARRNKGKPLPATIVIIDLNKATAYAFDSEKYLPYIETLYLGAASKNNGGFVVGASDAVVLNYGSDINDNEKLIETLRTNKFVKVHIDENDIVGWANTYYSANPGATKASFIGDDTGSVKIIGEIRSPDKLKDYILPYDGADNVRFQYLMDKLNDSLQKKDLGAFYTPTAYAEKSLELVREAIKRVPEGNDYVILDRCAGTGNLEKGMTDEELSHCILSTIEYYEYKVLVELLGDKVRSIIPPTEDKDTFINGNVRGADALSKDYIDNSYIKSFIDDPRCTMILFENPPYAETTSVEHQKRGVGKASSTWKNSFVVSEMKKEIKGTATNDMGNAFIWSGFHYYLRQPTDSYVVYSPVKYWKAQGLAKKEFIRGFAFNRIHYHANIAACIMCAFWSNRDDSTTTSIYIDAFDINDENTLVSQGKLPVTKIKSSFSDAYYDRRAFPNDEENGIYLDTKGEEADRSLKFRITPIYNSNIIGYLVATSTGFDNPDLNSGLMSAGRYNGSGFFIREDNYLQKLPMFAANRYITYNKEWTERGRIMKSADGSKIFFKAIGTKTMTSYLLKTLLFTCMEPQNHCRSFTGSDGRFYRNELCLDTTNGETVASKDLKALNPDAKEKVLLKQWDEVLLQAKKTKGYDPKLTYGIYQISQELNTSRKDPITGKTVYDYVELNTALQNMRALVKDYYNAEIVPTLFKYEFLK
jgi:hypothetical protein